MFTQNILSGGNTLEQENNLANNRSQNFNMDFRMEWEPDSLTTIIFRPNASIYNNTRSEIGDYHTRREQTGDTINMGDSEYYSEGNGNNIGGNLDVSRQLGTEGRVISALRANRGESENTGSSISTPFITAPGRMILSISVSPISATTPLGEGLSHT